MVSLYMLQHPLRGPGRGSMIAGCSVHNQRIERMWRDVFEGVLYIYYNLFYHLEGNDILDPTNAIHLFFFINIWMSGDQVMLIIAFRVLEVDRLCNFTLQGF